MRRRVFCIGFHKTGTTSMGELLTKLGYRVQGAYKTGDHAFVAKLRDGDLRELFEVAQRHDACKDNPWPVFFRELDDRFPASRFILTVRDPDAWIDSLSNHVQQLNRPVTPMRELIYGPGNPVGHEATYVARFERHAREVEDHFAARPDDLLTVDVSAPDALQRICRFLGIRPRRWWRMPHANRGARQ